jgi:hypothetical protein
LKRKAYTVFISLDISGAFDNASWSETLRSLRELHFPRNLYLILKSYLSDREVIIRGQNTELSKRLSKRCPQGSALGPALWNILYDGLLVLKLSIGVEVVGFADDTMLIVRGATFDQLRTRANRALETILRWGNKVRLCFNSHKTQAMIITRKKIKTPPQLILDHELSNT